MDQLQASALFITVVEAASFDGPTARRALSRLHRVLRRTVIEPGKIPGVRVLSCSSGAIVLVPDDARVETADLSLTVASAIARSRLEVRMGLAHGAVEFVGDADGTRNAVGRCMNVAARLAFAKTNPGILVERGYAEYAAGTLAVTHWLHPSLRRQTTVAGKRSEAFCCFEGPVHAAKTAEEADPESKTEEAAFVTAVLLAYDLPSFSDGDLRELTSRFRSVVQEVIRLKKDRVIGDDVEVSFSPGGDGAVLALSGLDLSRAHDVADRLERSLQVESALKSSHAEVRARIGVHYGRVFLYETAEGKMRPTGPTLFEADGLAGDEEARKHESIVVSEALIESVSQGSRAFERENFSEIASLSIAHGRTLRRWVRRSAERPQGSATSGSDKDGRPPEPPPSTNAGPAADLVALIARQLLGDVANYLPTLPRDERPDRRKAGAPTFDSPGAVVEAFKLGTLRGGEMITIRCRASSFATFFRNGILMPPMSGMETGERLGPPLVSTNPFLGMIANLLNHLAPVGLLPPPPGPGVQVRLYAADAEACGFIAQVPGMTPPVPSFSAFIRDEDVGLLHRPVEAHGMLNIVPARVAQEAGLSPDGFEQLRQAGGVFYVDFTDENAWIRAQDVPPIPLWGGLYACGHLEFEGELLMGELCQAFLSAAAVGGFEAKAIQDQVVGEGVIHARGFRALYSPPTRSYSLHMDTELTNDYGRQQAQFERVLIHLLSSFHKLAGERGGRILNPFDLDFSYRDSSQGYSVLRSLASDALTDPLTVAIRDWHRRTGAGKT